LWTRPSDGTTIYDPAKNYSASCTLSFLGAKSRLPFPRGYGGRRYDQAAYGRTDNCRGDQNVRARMDERRASFLVWRATLHYVMTDLRSRQMVPCILLATTMLMETRDRFLTAPDSVVSPPNTTSEIPSLVAADAVTVLSAGFQFVSAQTQRSPRI